MYILNNTYNKHNFTFSHTWSYHIYWVHIYQYFPQLCCKRINLTLTVPDWEGDFLSFASISFLCFLNSSIRNPSFGSERTHLYFLYHIYNIYHLYTTGILCMPHFNKVKFWNLKESNMHYDKIWTFSVKNYCIYIIQYLINVIHITSFRNVNLSNFHKVRWEVFWNSLYVFQYTCIFKIFLMDLEYHYKF